MTFSEQTPCQGTPTQTYKSTCNDSLPSTFEVIDQEKHYRVRHLTWDDTERLNTYQRLRAATFVHQLGWDIPVDNCGRERDRYDWQEDSSISVHCAYGIGQNEAEHLLSGIRLFELGTWDGSMVMREFHDVGMIPGSVLHFLERNYDCRELLELTRLCVQRGRWYTVPHVSGYPPTSFSCAVARDLAYAAVYSIAERTRRWKVLGIANTGYLQVMRRSRFVFQEIYAQHLDKMQGYALTIIDLLATIHAIRAAGDHARADRMTALCAVRY